VDTVLAYPIRLALPWAIGLQFSSFPSYPQFTAFLPPFEQSLQDGEVGHAVDPSFHTAGATGLQGRQGVVEPHIHAVYQLPGQLLVIVLRESDPPGELGVLRQAKDLLDQPLAVNVDGVGLAGEAEVLPAFVLDCVHSRARPAGRASETVPAPVNASSTIGCRPDSPGRRWS